MVLSLAASLVAESITHPDDVDASAPRGVLPEETRTLLLQLVGSQGSTQHVQKERCSEDVDPVKLMAEQCWEQFLLAASRGRATGPTHTRLEVDFV